MKRTAFPLSWLVSLGMVTNLSAQHPAYYYSTGEAAPSRTRTQCRWFEERANGQPRPFQTLKRWLSGEDKPAVFHADAAAADRVETVRMLAAMDHRTWPEAELALIAALRRDRHEWVRLESAKALGKRSRSQRAIEALRIAASGSNEDGYPREDSPYVRKEAMNALKVHLARMRQGRNDGTYRMDVITAHSGAMTYYENLSEQSANDTIEKALAVTQHAATPTRHVRQPVKTPLASHVRQRMNQALSPSPVQGYGAATKKPAGVPGHNTAHFVIPADTKGRTTDRMIQAHVPATPAAAVLKEQEQARSQSVSQEVSQTEFRQTSRPFASNGEHIPSEVPSQTPSRPRHADAQRSSREMEPPPPPPVPGQNQSFKHRTDRMVVPSGKDSAAGSIRRATPDVQELLMVLRNSIYAMQREWAVKQLGRCDWRSHPEVVDALLTAVRHDESANVRITCLRTLADMDVQTQSVISTIRALRTHPDPRIEKEAENALKRLLAANAPPPAPQPATSATRITPASFTAQPPMR
ncbi:MAG: hypothetical protein KatS3mg105_0562 [Gemmatales bacterium]|nr:MAG: hypothetical protein KatS3mg105_0562 [Gemmatales bacterium]